MQTSTRLSRASSISAFTNAKTSRLSKRSGSRQLCKPTAAIDPQGITAVTQQTLAFAVVVGGEAVYTGLNTKSDMPGRPQILTTLIGTLGTVAASALVMQGDATGKGGCILGALVSGYMIYTYAIRVKECPYDPLEWPGKKAWPAVMALISFFSLMAFYQGGLE